MRIGLDISVLSNQKKTGIAVYIYNLIDALLKINRNDEFVLFGISTLDTYKHLKNIEFKKYPNVELVIKKLPAKFFRTAFILWQRLDWPPIEYFIKEVDIFHSFNWFLPPQRHGSKVATVFDMTTKLFPELHHKRTVELENIRLERIKRLADLVVTISQNSRKDFQKFSPDSRVEVIYPAADNFKRRQNLDKNSVRKILQKYHIRNKYFLSVATLEPRKNLPTLINAYLKGCFTADLVLVGTPGWGEGVAQITSSKKVKFLGFIAFEDLQVLYKNAEIFIYPSLYEGFGLPVLEAMLSGTCVICSNTSSLTEVGGDALLYINPKSEESIKEAIEKIEKNDNLKKRLIEKGFKQADKFSWRKSAEKLNLLYQKL